MATGLKRDAVLISSLIQADNLFFQRGGVRFKNLSFGLKSKEKLAISGKNGAGKTTLIKILTGILCPDSGAVTLESYRYLGDTLGLDINDTLIKSMRKQIDLLPHLKLGWPFEKALEACLLTTFANRPLYTLSAGQRQRFALSCLRLHSVNLWILDEPYRHLDAENSKWLTQFIDAFTSQGGAVILSCHTPFKFHVDQVLEL